MGSGAAAQQAGGGGVAAAQGHRTQAVLARKAVWGHDAGVGCSSTVECAELVARGHEGCNAAECKHWQGDMRILRSLSVWVLMHMPVIVHRFLPSQNAPVLMPHIIHSG